GLQFLLLQRRPQPFLNAVRHFLAGGAGGAKGGRVAEHDDGDRPLVVTERARRPADHYHHEGWESGFHWSPPPNILGANYSDPRLRRPSGQASVRSTGSPGQGAGTRPPDELGGGRSICTPDDGTMR